MGNPDGEENGKDRQRATRSASAFLRCVSRFLRSTTFQWIADACPQRCPPHQRRPAPFQIERLEERTTPTSLVSLGSISGHVFADVDGDSLWSAGEPALSDITVFLDLNNDGDLDGEEPSTLTTPTGDYTFVDVPPGVYYVRQLQPEQMFQTTPNHLLPHQTIAEGHAGVQGLAGVHAVAVSPDGRHVYTISSEQNSLAVFLHTDDGGLGFVEALYHSTTGVSALDAPYDLAISPDGQHVYVTSPRQGALSVFGRRDDGTLATIDTYINGQAGFPDLLGIADLDISPDGQHLYATNPSDNTLTVFLRQQDGTVQYLKQYCDGQTGFDGLRGAAGLAVSPDGRYVYVAAPLDDSFCVFARQETGELTLLEQHYNQEASIQDFSGPSQVAVSPDSRHVYVTGLLDDTLTAFVRQDDGTLALIQVLHDGQHGVDGLWRPSNITISPDGHYVYVAAFLDDALSVFARDDSGQLAYLESHRHAVDDTLALGRASGLTVNPLDAQVYITSPLDSQLTAFDPVALANRVVVTDSKQNAQADFGNCPLELTLTIQDTWCREGEEFITAQIATTHPRRSEGLDVHFLPADNPHVSLPSCVTIPAGTQETTFSIELTDDIVPAGNSLITITAIAENHSSSQCSLTVVDDDGLNTALDATTFSGLSELATVEYGQVFADDLTPVDPERVYQMAAWARSGDDQGDLYVEGNRQYAGFASYDADKLLIRPWHVLGYPGAVETRLARSLRPGDQYVYLDRLDGWSNGGPSYTRSLAWYGYQNSYGFVYPDYTYTRHVLQEAWDAGAVQAENQRIQLREPWSGPELSAGTAVRNATSGAHLNYVLASAGAVPNQWTRYSAQITGVGATANQFRPGTAYVQPAFLTNYGVGDPGQNRIEWREVRWACADAQTYHGGDRVELRAQPSGGGDSAVYSWRQLGGPAVILQDADERIAWFEAPADEATQLLIFELGLSEEGLVRTEQIELMILATFSDPVHAALDATTFAGESEISTLGYAQVFADDLTAVDPAQSYEFSGWACSGDDQGNQYVANNCQYAGFASYDADKLLIRPWHVLGYPGAADTRLARPLQPGDEYVYLDHLDGWSNGGPSYTRSLAWYGYENSYGFVYADYTYTRDVLQEAWDDGAVDAENQRIQLRQPWSGPDLPAGTAVRNATSGSHLNYVLVCADSVPNEWTRYSAEITGVGDTGNNFRPGTAYVCPVVLTNYGPGDKWSNLISWRDLSWKYTQPEKFHGGDRIELRAASLSGSDGSASYAWRQTSGPEVLIYDSDQPVAWFYAPPSTTASYSLSFLSTVSNATSSRTSDIVLDIEMSTIQAGLDATTFAGLSDLATVDYRQVFADDLTPIDPERAYQMTAWARSGDDQGDQYVEGNRQYAGFASYDADKLLIRPWHVFGYPGAADTRLARPLQPGDQYVYLDQLDGWSNGGPSYTRSLAWYGYQNSYCVIYADYTYTRHVLQDAWDAGAVQAENKRIQLRQPWSGPELAAGTAVRNATSGAHLNYVLVSAEAVPNQWTRYAARITGVGDAANQFRPGTAYVQPAILTNYGDGDRGQNRIAWRDVRWACADAHTYHGGDRVELRAHPSGSGDSAVYSWRQLGGPVVTLQDADERIAWFEAPADEATQLLSFELSLSEEGLVRTERIELTILATFSAPVYAALDATTFAGESEISTLEYAQVFADDLTAVDPTQSYELSGWARSGDDQGNQYVVGNCQYAGFAAYDGDKLLIRPWHVLAYHGAVDTRLARPLRPGDEYVYLDQLDGWSNAGPSYTRSLAWYGYENSSGFVYADYTYTRHVLQEAWDARAVDAENQRIRLRQPWSGPDLPAGTAVRNATSGPHLNYVLVCADSVPNEWTRYSAEITGVGVAANELRPGTAYVQPAVLTNYGVGDRGENRIEWRDLRWDENKEDDLSAVTILVVPQAVYRAGDMIDFVAQGLESGDSREYSFWLCSSDSTWELKKDFGRDGRWTWDSNGAEAGSVSVRVEARWIDGGTSCTASDTVTIEVRTSVSQVWEEVFCPYMTDDLWSDSYAYQAAISLMVPLHDAFAQNSEERICQFVDYFERLCAVSPEELPEVLLNRLQHLYLASRFVALCHANGRPQDVPHGLADLLFDEVMDAWYSIVDYAGPEAESMSMRELLHWKLDTVAGEVVVERMITPHELFTMAIAADLRQVQRLATGQGMTDPVLEEISAVTIRVFRQEVQSTAAGGWVFQPGVWTLTNGHAYAGNCELREGICPAPVAGIAPDSSHSHRFPLWLRSFIEAAGPGTRERAFYEDLERRLEIQFCEVVLVAPTRAYRSYRTTNYMDGCNGVYRYKYLGQEQRADGLPWGYGPFELSSTILTGWWSFLGTDRIRRMYEKQAELFPLTQEVIDTFTGPSDNQGRHPLLALPDCYENGYYESMMLLAARLSSA